MNIGGVGIGGLDSVMTPLLPGDPSPSLGWPSAGWGSDDDTSYTHCVWNMSIKMKMVIRWRYGDADHHHHLGLATVNIV